MPESILPRKSNIVAILFQLVPKKKLGGDIKAGQMAKWTLSLMVVQHVWVSTVKTGSAERRGEAARDTYTDRGAFEDHKPELCLLPLVRPPSHCRRGHPSVCRDTQPEPLPPQDHHRMERNLSYSAKSSPLAFWQEALKRELIPRAKAFRLWGFHSAWCCFFDVSPRLPHTCAEPTIGGMSKRRDQKEVRWVHSASVFSRRSQSCLILRGSWIAQSWTRRFPRASRQGGCPKNNPPALLSGAQSIMAKWLRKAFVLKRVDSGGMQEVAAKLVAGASWLPPMLQYKRIQKKWWLAFYLMKKKKERLKVMDVSALFPSGFGKSFLTVCGSFAKALLTSSDVPKKIWLALRVTDFNCLLVFLIILSQATNG